MATTSRTPHVSNTRVRSWLISPDKVGGRVSFVSLRRRDGFKVQAAMAAVGPRRSTSSTALCVNPLVRRLLPVKEKEVEGSDQEKGDPITDENLDEWIKDSVSEIVRNIGEAPFLVQIFSKEGRGKGVRVVREQSTPDRWPNIKKRWAHKQSHPPPDGIILVDRLTCDLEEKHEEKHRDGHRKAIGSDSGPGAGSNKVWGLVVQGRGTDYVTCYILNTCRVQSPAGFCTHFCLARAKCFGDPFELQLRNAWLQGRR